MKLQKSQIDYSTINYDIKPIISINNKTRGYLAISKSSEI